MVCKNWWIVPVFAVLCMLSGSVGLAWADDGAGSLLDDNASEYTLEQCVTRALRENPRIHAAQDDVYKAQAEVGMARAGFLPKASLTVYNQRLDSIYSTGPVEDNYEDQTINFFDIRASQTLFAGMTVLNGYKRALVNKALIQAQKEQEEASLVFNVRTAFLERLKAMEDVRRLEASKKRLDGNMQVVRAMFDKEMAPYSSVLEAETDIFDVNQQISQARNIVATKTIELKSLLDLPFENQVVFKGDLHDLDLNPPCDLESSLSYALVHRPEVKVATYTLGVAVKDREIAKGAFYPRISLNVDYYGRNNDYDELGGTSTYRYDQDKVNDYTSVQLMLEWDLFQGGKKYYQVSRAGHEISRLRNHIRDLKSGVSTDVRTSFFSLQEARERIGYTHKFVESARENYARAQARLRKIVGSIPEVLAAQERLSNAEASSVKALADYRLALATLYYSMGQSKSSLTR